MKHVQNVCYITAKKPGTTLQKLLKVILKKSIYKLGKKMHEIDKKDEAV